jgi:hypothetical protein
MANFEIVTVHKITATKEPDVYEFDVTVSNNGEEERFNHLIFRPDDPYGASPALHAWMTANPDFPVQPSTPPTLDLNDRITTAPADLTGGPTLAEIFDAPENPLVPTV